MSLVRNEQIKLLANFLDRAATACLTVGVITPAAAYLYGAVRGFDPWLYAAAFCAWFCAAIGLHLLARRRLRGLR